MKYNITFYKEKYVVKLNYLFYFMIWFLNQSTGIYFKLRKIGSLFFYFQLRSKEAEIFMQKYPSYFMDFSWFRYASDGTRIQIYDHKKSRVIKVSLKNNKEQMQKEINSRKLLGEACPEILEYDLEKGILVEKWMNLKPTLVDFSTAYNVFLILKERFYNVQIITAADYINGFYFLKDKNKLQKYLNENNINVLKITPVHGDIWSGNLLYDDRGNLIILDWEYTGICILSYDVWLYMFQVYKSKKLLFNIDFYIEFSKWLSKVYNEKISESDARVFHLLHLLERYRLYILLKMEEKKEEMDFFKKEINQILQIL